MKDQYLLLSLIHPMTKGRPQNRWEDDIPKLYKEIGILMTEINN